VERRYPDREDHAKVVDVMKPVLHDENVTTVGNFGYGTLSDALECTVSCEENGTYDLTLQYPVTGIHAEKLLERRIISARPSSYETRQLFRIYRINRPMNGRFQVSAHHISYDLGNCIVKPFSAKSLRETIQKLNANIVGDCKFEISADYDNDKEFSVTKPVTVRAAMLSNGGSSIADTYLGYWEFDGLKCTLRLKEEVNRGAVIAYGLNLVDVTQEKNIDNVYTHVYPYWTNAQKGKFYALDPIKASNIEGYQKIYPLDLTSYFQKAPSDASMRKATTEFLSKNQIGKIEPSLTVSYVQLEKTVEYKDQKNKVILRGDTVEVRYLRLGVNVLARVTKTDYDVVHDRYASIYVGKASEKLARTTVKDRNRMSTTNDRAVDASRVATDYIGETDDGGIQFGPGSFNYTINEKGLEFHGIKNLEPIRVWQNEATKEPLKSLEEQTISVDLTGYSAILITYESTKGTTWFAGGGSGGRVSSIIPVNGKTYTLMYAWNTPHFRNITVYQDSIEFGPGKERTSKYSPLTGTIWTNIDLETPTF
jgi:phage minor structural protein